MASSPPGWEPPYVDLPPPWTPSTAPNDRSPTMCDAGPYTNTESAQQRSSNSDNAPTSDKDSPLIVSSFLAPRVAVVLRVPPAWHPWLFASRLLSIGPALLWSWTPTLQLLLALPAILNPNTTEYPIPVTEMILAMLWVSRPLPCAETERSPRLPPDGRY
jgi:hypothetical protein